MYIIYVCYVTCVKVHIVYCLSFTHPTPPPFFNVHLGLLHLQE